MANMNPSPYTRRLADLQLKKRLKKALRKMGVPQENAPSPAHGLNLRGNPAFLKGE